MNKKETVPGWKIEVTNGSNKIDLFCPYGVLEYIIHSASQNGNVCAVSECLIEFPVEVSVPSDLYSTFGLKPIEP